MSSIYDQIRALAAYNARHDHTDHLFKLYLMSWWSTTYNRPLKDPILLSYTLEELVYEYYDYYERKAAKVEAQEVEADRIEIAKDEAAESWADKMEREEEEREALKLRAKEETIDPREDPKNIEWMEKLVEDEKKKRGEDFGEDVEVKF